MPDCTVRLAPLDVLALRWPMIEPLLRRATARTGCYEPIDLLRLAMAGQMGVWLIERGDDLVACAVTEVKQYPRKRVLEVPFIAGEGLAGWHAALLSALDAHAAQLHCGCIVGTGRPGWQRFGFRNDGPILVREIAE